MRRLWRWLNKPRPPECNADWMTLGWGGTAYDVHGHYTDCPVHGAFAGADTAMERERAGA